MKKVKFNAWVNIFSFLSFSASATSGFLLRSFPSGSGRRGNLVWGLVKKDWHEIHYYASLAIVASVILHLLFHLPYIKNLPKLLFSKGSKS